MLSLLQRGADMRHTGETRLNEKSSRSHSVFTVTVEKVGAAAPLSPAAALLSRRTPAGARCAVAQHAAAPAGRHQPRREQGVLRQAQPG
jgi:hypothetical protein